MNKYESLRNPERWRDFALPDASVVARDVHGLVRNIVAAISAEIAPDVVALDSEKLPDEKTDTLIAHIDGRTSIVPLRFTRNLFIIDGTPIFVACDGGVLAMANAIIAELERLHWRAMN